jgi:hypothetical protein
MPTHAQSAIIAKIKRLERERKQVMAHLHLLDDNIETLAKSLDILQSEQNMTAYDTDSFSYRPKLRASEHATSLSTNTPCFKGTKSFANAGELSNTKLNTAIVFLVIKTPFLFIHTFSLNVLNNEKCYQHIR